MTRAEPQTETIDASAAREQWDQLLERVHTEDARFLVERDGKPVAAIISTRDLEVFQRYLQQRIDLFAAIEEMREAFTDVPSEEIEREIERVIAEVRAERRAAALAEAATR
jgi:PHD/YefM family antitoxin component YafN of YafNO toxin-antitoxin module